MKILICGESFYPEINGVSVVLTNLAKEFLKKNIQVSVATKKIARRKKIKQKNFKLFEFDITGNLVRGIRGEKKKFVNFLKYNKYDYIFFYAAQQWSFDLSLDIIEKLDSKIIFAPCGFSRLNNVFYKNYFRKLSKKIKKFDLLIFHSKYYQDYKFASANKAKKLKIISNGANFKKEKLLVNKKKITIISEIKYNKGIDRSLLSLLMSNLKNKQLDIYSQKTNYFFNFYYFYILLLSFLLKFKKINCKFHYNITGESLEKIRKRTYVLLFGSRLECSPLTLFESASSGCPFITFNSGNSYEISKLTGCGINVKSISEMTKKINLIYSNPDLRNRLSKNGIKNRSKFLWSKISDNYFKLIKSL